VVISYGTCMIIPCSSYWTYYFEYIISNVIYFDNVSYHNTTTCSTHIIIKKYKYYTSTLNFLRKYVGFKYFYKYNISILFIFIGLPRYPQLRGKPLQKNKRALEECKKGGRGAGGQLRVKQKGNVENESGYTSSFVLAGRRQWQRRRQWLHLGQAHWWMKCVVAERPKGRPH